MKTDKARWVIEIFWVMLRIECLPDQILFLISFMDIKAEHTKM